MRNRVLLILFLIFTNLSFGQSTEQQFFDQAAISYYKKDYKKAADQVQLGLDKFPNSSKLSELKEKIHAKISVVQNPKPVDEGIGGDSGGVTKDNKEDSIGTTEIGEIGSDVVPKKVEIRANLKEISTNNFAWNSEINKHATSVTIVFKNKSGQLSYDVTNKSYFQFSPGDPKWDGYKATVELLIELPSNIKLTDNPKLTAYTTC